MPVQTAIQTRRGTASSWTSTNPTLAAGEIGFETDTGKFKIGTGSSAWASLPYAAIDAGLLAAKGDLVTATANDTPAVLTVGANETRLVADSATATGLKYVADTTNYAIAAKGDLLAGTAADTVTALTVGSNGETLVADSSTTTGLRWQGDWNTGKNKIINGDFNINQRKFSSTTSSGTYGFDRWRLVTSGDGTCTMSAQTFTPGAAPVAGYEGRNFLRLVTASQTNSSVSSFPNQLIEDVRTFAGQTITISFWAKAASGTPKIAIELEQGFGTGGSPSAGVTTYAGQVTISTTWNRYSVTVAVPSISGKTLGTNNDSLLSLNLWISAGSTFNSRTGSLGIQNGTFDFWGVQVEAGSVATPFTTATGTLAGELAACQRYFARLVNGADNANDVVASGFNYSTTQSIATIRFPVPMRGTPTASVSNVTHFLVYAANAAANGTTGFVLQFLSPRSMRIDTTIGAANLVAGNGTLVLANSASATLDVSAEL